MITEYLVSRWPDIFGEPRQQREANVAAGGMKPEGMSWEQWCDDSRRDRFFGPIAECHWYDPPELSHGQSCRGDLHHNHQPRIMRWYWASPLSWIIPPLYFFWESGGLMRGPWRAGSHGRRGGGSET